MARLDSLAKVVSVKTQRQVDKYLNSDVKFVKPFPKLPQDFVKFNKIIGLPNIPGKPATVFDYQIEIDKAITEHHKVIINKSRKIGATETVLRYIAKNCFAKYAGYNVMIVAGNRQAAAEDILSRFAKLFERGFTHDGIRYSYGDIIRKKTRSELVFFNDTRIHTYPANPEALRGPDRVACVFLDEAAHFKINNDIEVYNALKPNLANTNGDFILVSTPNGRRGFFYDLWQGDLYHKLELPYTVALGGLISEEFIEKEKKDNDRGFSQEYECKFTTSVTAAFDPEDVDRNFEPDLPIERFEDLP